MGFSTCTDSTINFENYGGFSACSVAKSGDAVCFLMPCGVEYIVPRDYFYSWFNEPTCFCAENGRRDWKAEDAYDWKAKKIIRCERVTKDDGVQLDHWNVGFCVRVYVQRGAVFVIGADTVLMACEPGFEYFGGLTRRSDVDIRKRIMGGGDIGLGVLREDRLLFSYYGKFRKCSVDNNGHTIEFVMGCGEVYRVELHQIMRWPTVPADMRRRPVSGDRTMRRRTSELRAVRCKRMDGNTRVRIYLSDKTSFDIEPRDILTFFDERYEGYRGKKTSKTELVRILARSSKKRFKLGDRMSGGNDSDVDTGGKGYIMFAV